VRIVDAFTADGFLILVISWIGCIAVALIPPKSQRRVAAAKRVSCILLVLYLIGMIFMSLYVQSLPPIFSTLQI
jgi:hypothetical protein